MVRGDGDASQDDREDEDTNTSEERLPLPGHAMCLGARLTDCCSPRDVTGSIRPAESPFSGVSTRLRYIEYRPQGAAAQGFEVVERSLHTREVTGSNPVSPTIADARSRRIFVPTSRMDGCSGTSGHTDGRKS